MSLDLEELEIELLGFEPEYAQVMEKNLSISVQEYGIGESSSADIEVGICSSCNAEIEINVLDGTETPDVYAVPIHDGRLFIYWEIGENVDFAYMEIYGSSSLNGAYIPFLSSPGRKGTIINNIPIGFKFFLKSRVVTAADERGDFVQVRRGRISSGNITCEIRAINGSVIRAGAIFPVTDTTSWTITALSVVNDISITDTLTMLLEPFSIEIDVDDASLVSDIVVYSDEIGANIDIHEVCVTLE